MLDDMHECIKQQYMNYLLESSKIMQRLTFNHRQWATVYFVLHTCTSKTLLMSTYTLYRKVCFVFNYYLVYMYYYEE